MREMDEDLEKEKIAVIGLGYVGSAAAIAFSRCYRVTVFDIDREKTDRIINGKAPVCNGYMQEYMSSNGLHLDAADDIGQACRDADFVMVAVPTDYDSEAGCFDTSVIGDVIGKVLSCGSHACIVIRSTVSVGYTEKIKKETGWKRILYCPEFLRESQALHDVLYPDRVIIGADDETADDALELEKIIRKTILREDTEIMLTGTREAESVKLFSNTYLAMRVAFFNELDTFSETRGICAEDVIRGVCLDPRIGDGYNNPSFGYGGYCLPKDSKGLLSDYGDAPQCLISAVVDGNGKRKSFIAGRILDAAGDVDPKDPPVIGIYRIVMKAGSDNFKNSSVIDVMDRLRQEGAELIIYEPLLPDGSVFHGNTVVNDLDAFKERSRIVVANRYDHCLDGVKVYTRDLFGRD